jgi:zinc and cadmium transporter
MSPDLLLAIYCVLVLLASLAVAVQSGVHGNAKIAGLGVALVVILHKPFDAMAVSTLTAISGKSRSFRHVLNGLFAFASPIGAVLFYFGMGYLASGSVPFLGCALGFCAGSFLCISSADLLPELQFHSHDRFKLSIALLAGLAVAIIIKHFENG